VVFEADSPDTYKPGTRMRQLTSRAYTPVFVFLDSTGKKVVETAGFKNPGEARALHQFVTKRHYLKTSWANFAAKNAGR
jgi:thioredoxin-related protein